MKISGIIWLQEIVEKISRKHRVDQEEVREILSGSAHFRFVEKGHRKGENVYSLWARPEGGVTLLSFLCTKGAGTL